MDYCNAVHHGAPTSSIQKLQRMQNSAARISGAKTITHQVTSPQAALAAGPITYKLAVLTFQIITTLMPTYLSYRIRTRDSVRTLRLTTNIQLSEPFVRFPHTWNSRPKTARDSDSLGTFKSQLICHAYN